METIAWSMKVIATAKIIAARIRFLDLPPVLSAMAPPERCPPPGTRDSRGKLLQRASGALSAAAPLRANRQPVRSPAREPPAVQQAPADQGHGGEGRRQRGPRDHPGAPDPIPRL